MQVRCGGHVMAGTEFWPTAARSRVYITAAACKHRQGSAAGAAAASILKDLSGTVGGRRSPVLPAAAALAHPFNVPMPPSAWPQSACMHWQERCWAS